MLVAVAAGCAPRAAGEAPASTPREVAPDHGDRWIADLSFEGGQWSVTYHFPAPQSALLFDSAHGAYRVAHWSASREISLENLFGLDGMFFDEPRTTARFSIDRPPQVTEGTTAFVPFSDGSQAIWAGQLALLTVASREAAEALGGDLSAWRGEQPLVHVRVNSDVPLLGPEGVGRRLEGTAHRGRGPFFYAGANIDRTSLEGSAMVIDPGLPAWVQAAFRVRMPEVQAVLAQRWSHSLSSLQLMLAWGGGVGPWSNRGRAEGRQIVMLVGGVEYLKEDPRLLGELVWFFAHEMTHLHQFADEGDGEPWMIEGFADTMATDVLVTLGLWNDAVLERRYWSVARECAQLLAHGPLAGARGRVGYVCGDLVGVALMSLLPDRNLARLWEEARSKTGSTHDAGSVTMGRLLEAARELGASERGLAAVEAFVTGEHDDTDAAIRTLLDHAGLEPRYVKGSLSTMRFPFQP